MTKKLKAESSQLLVIDVQERLAPVMFEMEKMTKNALITLEAARHLNIPVLVSEQYRKGLGATIEPLRAASSNAPVMEKMHFSCWDDEAMRQHLSENKASGRDQFVLLGVEAHICVAQTALDLAAEGNEVFVVADATTSRESRSVRLALERMRAAGCSIITAEMALFEWLHLSGTEDFKKLSKLVK
jgi:nicotinamidase-related amidase